MSGGGCAEPLAQVLTRRSRGMDQSVALDHLEGGKAGRARDRPAAEGGAVQVVSLQRPVGALPEAPSRDHHRDGRQPAGESLCQEEHVRFDVLLLAEEEIPATTEPGLDFVEDKE